MKSKTDNAELIIDNYVAPLRACPAPGGRVWG
jgi:hypothetical protein